MLDNGGLIRDLKQNLKQENNDRELINLNLNDYN